MFSSYLPISSEGGDVSFQNNVPDPDTCGKGLPTFKFELEKSEGRVMGGSYGREATVVQLTPALRFAWSRSGARTALACRGRRMGIGHRRPRAYHRHRSHDASACR